MGAFASLILAASPALPATVPQPDAAPAPRGSVAFHVSATATILASVKIYWQEGKSEGGTTPQRSHDRSGKLWIEIS